MSSEVSAPDATPELDPSDPAYWCDPKFKIVAPELPPVAMLTCPHCSGTAYSDGAGVYTCGRCRLPAA